MTDQKTDLTRDPDRAAALEWFAREMPWHAAQCTTKHPWVSSIDLRDRCVAAYLAGVKRERRHWLRMIVDYAKGRFSRGPVQVVAALAEPT